MGWEVGKFAITKRIPSKTYRGVVSICIPFLNVHDKIHRVRKKSDVEVVLLVG